MMDSTLLPIDKVYEAITTPAKRRKIVIRKRETADPKAIQNARSLGKDLFAEMGPDGEDGLCSFLQGKLKGWQTALNGYKQLADTGELSRWRRDHRWPDAHQPAPRRQGQQEVHRAVQHAEERSARSGRQFHDLEHFYDHQKPTWEKLRKAHAAFQLNRLELERDAQAGPALKRMQEILSAPSPYGLIKEAEDLITTVSAVNSSLLTGRRTQAIAKIDAPHRHARQGH